MRVGSVSGVGSSLNLRAKVESSFEPMGRGESIGCIVLLSVRY